MNAGPTSDEQPGARALTACTVLAATLMVATLIAAGNAAAETEPNDTPAQATDIFCPAFDATDALIEPGGDVDYYRIVNPDGLIVVDVDADILGTGLDAAAGLFDTALAAFFINDDGSAAGEPPGLTDPFLAVPVDASSHDLVYLVVGSGGDADLDGVPDPGATLSTGAYELSVRCEPAPPVPAAGALLASTGRHGATLIDVDPQTGAASVRSSLGAYGPVTEIAFCGGRMVGTAGGGFASVVDIDPTTGRETFRCAHDGFAINGLACVDELLYGSYIPQSGGASLSTLVTVGAPVAGEPAQVFDASGNAVDGAAPTSLSFARAAGGPVEGVTVEVEYQAAAPSTAAQFHLTVAHALSGIQVGIGSAAAGGSCEVLPCDVDLGWPAEPGTRTATVAVDLAPMTDSTGNWTVTLADVTDDAGTDGVVATARVTLTSRRCPLGIIGQNGFKTVAGLAWDEPTATLLGCTAAFDGFFGSLIAQDIATGAGELIGPIGISSCGALAFDPSGQTLYAGSGTADAAPGTLLEVDPATGAGTVVGATGYPGISGLAFYPPDADSDGVPDAADTCLLVANPPQIDSDGDGIGNVCDQDYNNDCLVNFADVAMLKAAFQSLPGDPNYNADVSMTGGAMPISFLELATLKSAFLGVPGPGRPGNACEVPAQ